MPKKADPQKTTPKRKSVLTSNRLSKKLAKKSGENIPTMLLSEWTPEKAKSRLDEYLADAGIVKLIEERATIGCSIGSIAATLGVSFQLFSDWVMRGKEDSAKYDPEFAKTSEMVLWDVISKGWAKARTVCEGMIMQTNPERFLKSRTSRLLGDDWVDDAPVASGEDDSSSMKLDMGADFIESLKELRKQNIDLNEVIDKDQLTLSVAAPKKKESSILAANGLIPNKNCSVPATIQEAANLIAIDPPCS